MRYPEKAVAIVTRLMQTFGFHFWYTANLAYLAPPAKDFLMGTKYLPGAHSMRK